MIATSHNMVHGALRTIIILVNHARNGEMKDYYSVRQYVKIESQNLIY